MPVDFQWDNEEKTVLRYTVAGNWNWNELHKTLRRSMFQFDRVDHPVETILDLRGSSKLPAGAFGHIRSLGKSQHPNDTERLVIIGLDKEVEGALAGDTREYRAENRVLRFVDDDEAANAVIAEWQG